MPRARRANIGRRSRQSNATALNRRSQSEEDRVRRNEVETQRLRRRNQLVNSEAPRNRRGRTSVYDIRQMERAAFNYDATIDYSMHAYIGQMNIECIHCKAIKFRNETPGMCCAGGKVKLPVLELPPEPLHSLVFGNSPTSKHCQQLHLLEDDTHWDATLRDASISSPPNQIRMLFAIIISTCFPSNPLELWNKYKDFMAEDILIRLQHRSNDPALLLTLEMYNEALIMIEDLCLTIANKALGQLGLTQPNRPMHDLFERELQREQQFDRDELRAFVQTYTPQLNDQQKDAYDKVMQAVNDNTGGLYFWDAPGGTGKTFLISLILATIRSERKITLALASSGIAATLLDGGHTAHSALKLPLNMQAIETPTCNISRSSGMAKVLQQTSIILWDECPMAHKKSLEALSRTLQDLRQSQQLFGGALILLSGDFRQTLPVIPRSTPADEINACLKKLIFVGTRTKAFVDDQYACASSK